MALTEKTPLVVRKKTHKFFLWVAPNGNVEYRVNTEDRKYTAKALMDNKVIFKETLEMYMGDNVEFVDGISLNELDYTQLKAEQNLALKSQREKKDEMREFTLKNKSRQELLRMVDKWKKATKSIVYRDKDQSERMEKYTVHTFIIGRESFRMIERMRDGERIVNPDYKIFTEYPKAGGIAAVEGEILVWKYYYEQEEFSQIDPAYKQGKWETARRLTFNEQICYEIIERYGTFSKKA